jgi:DNA-binding transcriptional regulator YhcF (GntR family)
MSSYSEIYKSHEIQPVGVNYVAKGFLMLPNWILHLHLFQGKAGIENLGAIVFLFRNARYSDTPKKFNVDRKTILLKKGQQIASIRYLEIAFGWGKDRIQRFLKNLVEEGVILMEKSQGITLITIPSIQSGSSPATQPERDQVQSNTIPETVIEKIPKSDPQSQPQDDQYSDPQSDPQGDRYKTERKNNKVSNNDNKKIEFAFPDQEFKEAFNTWLGYLTQVYEKKRKLLTAETISLHSKKLKSQSDGNVKTAIEMINYSIERGYSSVFKLDNKTYEQRQLSGQSREEKLANIGS